MSSFYSINFPPFCVLFLIVVVAYVLDRACMQIVITSFKLTPSSVVKQHFRPSANYKIKRLLYWYWQISDAAYSLTNWMLYTENLGWRQNTGKSGGLSAATANLIEKRVMKTFPKIYKH